MRQLSQPTGAIQRNKKYELLILNVILFVYPVEQFAVVHLDHILGTISPFRVIILPLCLLYLLLNRQGGIKATNYYIVGVILFFISSLLSIVASESFSAVFSLFGSIIQFAMAYVLIRSTGFSKSTLYIITTWVLFQIPSLIVAFRQGNLGMASRFCGLFFDPNYLCTFVNGGIIASAYLLTIEKDRIWRFYNIFIVSIGALMVFMSYSRGGMLILLLLVLIYLYVYNMKLMTIVAFISIPLISAMMVRAQNLTWSDGADNYFDGFLYRTFTLSSDVSEMTAGRSDYAQVFYDHIDEYIISGTDVYSYLEKYNDGHFVHNGLIEIMIQGGVIIGVVYLLIVILSIIKEILMAKKKHKIPIEMLICIGVLGTLTFLSFTSKLSWLCMGLLISLSTKEVFYKRCENSL